MSAAPVVAPAPAPRTDPTGLPTRIAAWARSAVLDLVYCAAICVWSVGSFAILVTGVSVTASLLVLVVGAVVWTGFVLVMRGATSVDRALAGWRHRQRVRASYRRPAARGLVPLMKAQVTDPQTWREFGWLTLAPLVAFPLGLGVLVGTWLALAFTTMPAWFWAVSDSPEDRGLTHLGGVTVDSLPEALAGSAIGLTMIPLVLLAARAVAALHSGLAARVLVSSSTR